MRRDVHQHDLLGVGPQYAGALGEVIASPDADVEVVGSGVGEVFLEERQLDAFCGAAPCIGIAELEDEDFVDAAEHEGRVYGC